MKNSHPVYSLDYRLYCQLKIKRAMGQRLMPDFHPYFSFLVYKHMTINIFFVYFHVPEKVHMAASVSVNKNGN